MNPNQLRKLIIKVLEFLDLYSESAVELLMLTAAKESKCGYYLEQLKGPARGIFQMEPATETDIWENFLAFNAKLSSKISKLKLSDINAQTLFGFSNIPYTIGMARIHYLRVTEKIPNTTDVYGLAVYWKTHYNTPQGKGSVLEAIENYKKYAF